MVDEGVMDEDGEEATPDLEERVVITSRRYFIAEDADGYTVRDHTDPDIELGRYPGTDDGYTDAEQQFRALRRKGRTIDRSLATILSFVAGISVAAWAMAYILEEFTFNPLQHPFQENLDGIQSVLLEIESSAYRVWIAALVGLVIIAIRVYLAEGINSKGIEYRSHLTKRRDAHEPPQAP